MDRSLYIYADDEGNEREVIGTDVSAADGYPSDVLC